ncbi:hypothetical protein PHET_04509 [Paragonimus heterotremus]|uniref:DNA-dependent protein kinase catalytic subunit CC3 domain-containing protein n=1 Tax=Paragonimus heterotremus TaxID=100268 RepID=A0A8J4TM27_9TREM|nr:hypothetical protein PHET_04509 [Paragonimus heterotremus]
MERIKNLMQTCQEQATNREYMLAISTHKTIESTILVAGAQDVNVYLCDLFTPSGYNSFVDQVSFEPECIGLLLEILQFFTRLFHKYSQHMSTFAPNVKEICCLIFFRHRAARVKETAMVVLRQILQAYPTNILQSPREGEELVENLLRELANRQNATIKRCVFLTLETLLNCKPILYHKYGSRVITILSAELKRQLSVMCKVTEFPVVAACLDSLTDLLTADNCETNPDLPRECFRYAKSILCLSNDHAYRYDVWKSACSFLYKCSTRLSIELLDGFEGLLTNVKNCMASRNADLSQLATKAYLTVLKQAGQLLCEQVRLAGPAESPIHTPALSTARSDLLISLMKHLMHNISTQSTSLPETVVAITGLSHICEICAFLMSSHEFLNAIYCVLDRIQSTEISRMKLFSTTSISIDSYDASQLLLAIITIYRVVQTTVSSKINQTGNHMDLERAVKLTNQLEQLAMQLALLCVELYPFAPVKLSTVLGTAIQSAVEHMTKIEVGSTNIWLTGSNDFAAQLIYRAVIRCCCHQPMVFAPLQIPAATGSSKQQKVYDPLPDAPITCQDYVPLWQALLGLDQSKQSSSDNSAPAAKATLRHFVQTVLRLIRRLDLNYTVCTSDVFPGNEETMASDKPTETDSCGLGAQLDFAEVQALVEEPSGLVSFRSPKDIVLFVNLVDLIEGLFVGTLSKCLVPFLPELIKVTVAVVSRFPLLAGFYKMLQVFVMAGVDSGFFRDGFLDETPLPSITHDEWLTTRQCLVQFVSGLSTLQAPGMTVQISTGQLWGDLTMNQLQFVFSLPVIIFIPSLNSPEFRDQDVREFAKRIYPSLYMAVIMGQTTCPYLWFVLSQSLAKWITELGSGLSITTRFLGMLYPSLRRMLTSPNTSSIVIHSPPSKTPLASYYDRLTRGDRKTRQNFVQTQRLLNRIQTLQVASAELDDTCTTAAKLGKFGGRHNLRAQIQLLRLLSKLGGPLLSFEHSLLVDSAANAPKSVNRSVWNSSDAFRFCVPFTDIRVYLVLTDPHLMEAVCHEVCQADGTGLIAGAEYLHALIRYMVGKLANTTQSFHRIVQPSDFHSYLIDSLTPCELNSIDAGHLFQSTTAAGSTSQIETGYQSAARDLVLWRRLILISFRLATNKHVHVNRLFRNLILQLTRWFGAYTTSSHQQAVCFFKTLVELLHLSGTPVSPSDPFPGCRSETDVLCHASTNSDLESLQNLAALCLRTFLICSTCRASTSSCVSTNLSQTANPKMCTQSNYLLFECLLDQTLFALSRLHTQNDAGPLTVLNKTLLPIMCQDSNLVGIHVFEILDTLLVALDTLHSEHTALGSCSTPALSTDNGGVLYDLLAKTIRRVVRIILLRSRDLPLGDRPIDESSAEYRKPALVRACEPKKAKLDALSSCRSTVDSTTSSDPPNKCRCPKGWREASLHACFWALFGRVAKPTSFQSSSQSGSDLEPGLGAWDGKESSWNRATSQWISSLIHSLVAYGHLLVTETFNTRMLYTILLQEGSSKLLNIIEYYVQWKLTRLVTEVDSDTQRLAEDDDLNSCWRVCQNPPCCCLKIVKFAVEVCVHTCENVSSKSEEQLFPPTHCIWQLFALNLLWADSDDPSSVCEMNSLQKYLCLISRLGFVYQEAIIQHFLSHVRSLTRNLDLLRFVQTMLTKELSAYRLLHPYDQSETDALASFTVVGHSSAQLNLSRLCHIFASLADHLKNGSTPKQLLAVDTFGPMILETLTQLQTCSTFDNDNPSLRLLVVSVIRLALTSSISVKVIEYLLDCLLSTSTSINTQVVCTVLGRDVLLRLLLFGETDITHTVWKLQQQSRALLTVTVLLRRIKALATNPVDSSDLPATISLMNSCLDVCLTVESGTRNKITSKPFEPTGLSPRLVDLVLSEWQATFDVLLNRPSCGEKCSSLVDLISLTERLLLLGSKHTDWQHVRFTVLRLLHDSRLTLSHKIRLLDMLSVLIPGRVNPPRDESHIQPTSSATALLERQTVCTTISSTLQTLLATHLPINNVEFTQDKSKAVDYENVFLSLLACLELTGSCEVLQALIIPFCRETDHPMDTNLYTSLQKTMTRHRSSVFAQLACLELCYAILAPIHSSSAEDTSSALQIDYLRRVQDKFLFPLLLFCSHNALESFATKHVIEWVDILQKVTSQREPKFADSVPRLLVAELCLNLFTLTYNRLPKQCIHDKDAQLVKIVWRADESAQSVPDCKGVELTRSVMKFADTIFNQVNKDLSVSSHNHPRQTAISKLCRRVLVAAWSCLSATVCATQTRDDFFMHLLSPCLFTRLLPDSNEFPFHLPEQHPILVLGRFLNVPEVLWSDDDFDVLDPHRSSSLSTHAPERPTDRASDTVTSEKALFEGSTLALELHRFDHLAGTQWFAQYQTDKHIDAPTPSKESPILGNVLHDIPKSKHFRQPPGVRLVQDSVNSEPLMAGFTGFLKRLCQLRAESNPNQVATEEPFWLQYLRREFSGPNVSVNVQTFILKLLINSPEAFLLYGQPWFTIISRFLLANPAGMVICSVPSPSFTTLFTDLCLILASWADQNQLQRVVPCTPEECLLGTQVLSMFVVHLGSWEGRTGTIQSSVLKRSTSLSRQGLIDLFELLIDCWEEFVKPPYQAFFNEFNRTDITPNQLRVTLELFRIVLRSNMICCLEDANPYLESFANALSSSLEHPSKDVSNAAFTISALFLNRFQQPLITIPGTTVTSDICITVDHTGSLQQPHIEPPSLQPLASHLWIKVFQLNSQQGTVSSSLTSPGWDNLNAASSLFPAVCQAAICWEPLRPRVFQLVSVASQCLHSDSSSLHSLLTLLRHFMLANSNPSELDFNTVMHCLFSTDKVDLSSSKMEQHFFNLLATKTSGIVELGLTVGAEWINFLTRYSDQSIPLAIYKPYMNSVLRTALRCLDTSRPKSIHAAAYQVCMASWKCAMKLTFTEELLLAKFGMLFGLSVESDKELSTEVRLFFTKNCLPAGTLDRAVRVLADCGALGSIQESLPEADLDWFRDLIGQFFPSLLSACVSLVLEPATLAAEYSQPFFDQPLDPGVSFEHLNLPDPLCVTTFGLDPTLASLAPLFFTQTAVPEDNLTSITGTLAPVSFTMTLLTEPTDSTQPAMGNRNTRTTRHDPSPTVSSISATLTSLVKSGQKEESSEANSFEPCTRSPHQLRVARIRTRLNARDLAQLGPLSPVKSPQKNTQQIFRERAVARHRAELRFTSLSARAFRGCGQSTSVPTETYRCGALPDVETVTPSSLIEPLNRLASVSSPMSHALFVQMFSSLLRTNLNLDIRRHSVSQQLSHSLNELLQLACQLATFSVSTLAVQSVVSACCALLSQLLGAFRPGSVAVPQDVPVSLDSTVIATSALLSNLESDTIVLLEWLFISGKISR